jgi:hypothetical protein
MGDSDGCLCRLRRGRYGEKGLIDFYELTRTYAVLKAGQVVTAPDPMTELKFCNARCLCEYVATNVAPDVAGE